MKTLCIVPCGNRKIWDVEPQAGPTRAGSVYIGPFARKCREYAEKYHPASWCILSAKYGFLFPEDIIPAPYNVSFNARKTNPISVGELSAQAKRKGLDAFGRIVVLGGRNYAEIAKAVFSTSEVCCPLSDCKGIGYMMGRLNGAIRSGVPLVRQGAGSNPAHARDDIAADPLRIPHRESISDEVLAGGEAAPKVDTDSPQQRICERVHACANTLRRFEFPFDEKMIPVNGIYILFEKGERAHGVDRIVRFGTHTGRDQLRSRLKQHFLSENKDRSIFRKNIGRSILSKAGDPFLGEWELDLTTSAAKQKFSSKVDFERQKDVEKEVSRYIQNNFSFAVVAVDGKDDRLELESKLISTVSLCEECRPTGDWLGLHSPKKKIRESGLWLVNELYKQPLSEEDFLKLVEFSSTQSTV